MFGTIKKAVKQAAKAATVGNNLNKPLEKVSVFKRELIVGDRVIHTPSNLAGVIAGQERIGGIDVLVVRLNSGRTIRGVNRQELRLGHAPYASAGSQAARMKHSEPLAPRVIDNRGFSQDSILDELA
jgi:hypothetical protein